MILKKQSEKEFTDEMPFNVIEICRIHPDQQERCNTMLSFFKQVYSGTLSIAMQELESLEQSLKYPTDSSQSPQTQVTAVHWFTASDYTSGELKRHGIWAVQAAGMWLSVR